MVLVLGISDVLGGLHPPGIPPGVHDAKLVKLVVSVDCPPDPFGGGLAKLPPSVLNFTFSNPKGQLIQPISVGGATIRILDPVMGDLNYSRAADVLDILKMIQCVFMNGCPNCSSIQTDFNCDHQIDVFDLMRLISYVFQGTPAPGC